MKKHGPRQAPDGRMINGLWFGKQVKKRHKANKVAKQARKRNR